jgi:hypothetical protein
VAKGLRDLVKASIPKVAKANSQIGLIEFQQN